MDYVLANKAVFKTGTAVAGRGGDHWRIDCGGQPRPDVPEVGAGLIAAGIISEVISANVTPSGGHAGVGRLAALPEFCRGQSTAPGPHEATVEFLDANGRALPMPQDRELTRAGGQARQGGVG